MSKRTEFLRDQRLEIYFEQHELCAACGMPLAFSEAELAHRIPEAIWASAKWGFKIIDHRKNKAMTHRGICNSSMLIQNHPVECDHLAAEILKEIELGKKASVDYG